MGDFIQKQISSWVSQNLNKDTLVPFIKIQVISDTCEGSKHPVVGPGGVSVIPLDPPGPVSLYLWHTNPEYRAGNFQMRKTILREFIVTLNEKFESELKGRQWNRKRAIEQLQEQYSSAVSPPLNTPELSKGICYVLGFQYMEVDEIHKKLFSYPEDLRTWSNEYPIYLVSIGCRSIYIKENHEEARSFFKSWFFDLEKTHTYEWPVSSGTLKELKDSLDAFGLNALGSKPKKDDYAIALGKAEAIRHLNKEFN